MPRNKFTPADRAQAAHEAAQSRVERAEAARDKAREAAGTAQVEYERALAFANYAANHPDLPARSHVSISPPPTQGTH